MIQPSKIDDVCEALLALDITDLTITEAHGFGRQNGHTIFYPDAGQFIDLLPKAKIELVVTSERLREAVACIAKTANTEKNGTGKIFLSTVLQIVNL